MRSKDEKYAFSKNNTSKGENNWAVRICFLKKRLTVGGLSVRHVVLLLLHFTGWESSEPTLLLLCTLSRHFITHHKLRQKSLSPRRSAQHLPGTPAPPAGQPRNCQLNKPVGVRRKHVAPHSVLLQSEEQDMWRMWLSEAFTVHYWAATYFMFCFLLERWAIYSTKGRTFLFYKPTK